VVAWKQETAIGQLRMTPQEYLRSERHAETKSEFNGGIVTAMAGASWKHNIITSNIQGELRAQLRGTSCVAVANDLRVRVAECDKYYYPDIVVVCGEPQFEDAELDTLLNPTLIVEVLSDSTAAKDRGEKLECYRTLDALNTYVLVAQDRPFIEIYRRQENGWLYSTINSMDAAVPLDSIGGELQLADVYDRIEFNMQRDKSDINPT